ncbi:MAG: hypothetical protein RL538_655 [Candidatus Parcubacteria bacterium]|jgi:ADP-ribose pyrophosphatase YjhB (NUDIX family)
MTEIRNRFYRVSVKALILNETRDKFLLCKQENDVWDLPGGGLDWGKKAHPELQREILEEMNIKTTNISNYPSYFLGGCQMTDDPNFWVVNVVYEVELEHLNFTPSDECVEIRFVDKADIASLTNVPPTVLELVEQFDPKNHTK